MELATLVAGSDPCEIIGDPRAEITGLACHTRLVEPGTLFFCVPGTVHDGHDFAGDAVAAGAAALVVERPLGLSVTQVVVGSVRRAMALAAATFYERPSTHLRITGVTGTNGKTTTAHVMASVFEAAGLQCALLGTVVNRINRVDQSVTLTTPDSIELQRLLREMVDAGDRACAMEASSHALMMDRTVGIAFDAVVFTNLTRDHLDFHGDLEAYYQAKRRLFLPDEERHPGAVAVVNIGDVWGRRLAQECAGAYGEDLHTYAVAGDAGDEAGVAGNADVVALDQHVEVDRSAFTLDDRRRGRTLSIATRLGGHFNVANATAAATTGLALGLEAAAVVDGLSAVSGVPGRFEAVRAGQPFGVLIDYAHTPDSLENALRAARSLGEGRLLAVFGCGGDRDRGKRPQMGAAAAQLADVAYVTSDNPRSEDPEAIIADILTGIPEERRGAVVVEPDRRRAIGAALSAARSGDVVVIAGKGHETGQLIGSERLPFDDRQVADEVLRDRRRKGT
jgi:UDP-N-acetylmuramoyl-L-alanyl-D-glutamate--2,6-diaminopimelate ligase